LHHQQTKFSLIRRILHFVKFYFSAITLHGVHSPFVFDFCKKILEDRRNFYAYGDLVALREQLKLNSSIVDVNDFGAGSLVLPKKKKKISEIARTSATATHFAKILFKTALNYQPKSILELGTSLGISTLYFSKAHEKATVFTVEGCPNVAAWAQHNFKLSKAKNIRQFTGEFGKSLPETLKEIDQLDLVFIDGNHRYQPTMDYFELCLKKTTDNSILIFDDIYWSEEMTKAWEEIKNDPRVTQSIDLYQFGYVFFKKDFKAKQHWKLVPLRWKPWRVW